MLDASYPWKSATSVDENRWFVPRGSTGATRCRIEDDRLLMRVEDPDGLELGRAERHQWFLKSFSAGTFVGVSEVKCVPCRKFHATHLLFEPWLKLRDDGEDSRRIALVS